PGGGRVGTGFPPPPGGGRTGTGFPPPPGGGRVGTGFPPPPGGGRTGTGFPPLPLNWRRSRQTHAFGLGHGVVPGTTPCPNPKATRKLAVRLTPHSKR
ncbi:MAG: hypothetical protein EI684_10320, partial [Candidatus Viridilinea halotolerans]